MKALTLEIHTSDSMRFTQGLLMVLSVLIVLGLAPAVKAYTVAIDSPGLPPINDCGSASAFPNSTWDENTKTCTLKADVSEIIVILSSGITLDGNGYTLTGPGSGVGVSIQGRSPLENVTVKNLTIQNFETGIAIYNSRLTRIYNNNFINNSTNNISYISKESGTDENLFSLDPPAGGNYWDDYDTPEEGCRPDGDFCENGYPIDIYKETTDGSLTVVGTAYDEFPWIKKDGWKTPAAVMVALDVKPGSCPNPVNVKSRGVIPVAILGAIDFDVRSINLLSLRLEEVAPVRSVFVDVATPYHPWTDDNGCNELGDDGYEDLLLKFKAKDILAALGDVNDGDILTLVLTGELTDGTRITASDTISILKKGNFKKHK